MTVYQWITDVAPTGSLDVKHWGGDQDQGNYIYGATGGVTYKLFLDSGPAAKLDDPPIAVFERNCKLKLAWASPSLLFVQYNGESCNVAQFKSYR